jgi:glycosyltransferase involved in cell wall biosynthesis
MSEPLVSVFLPVYNQEAYVEEAIRSAAEQDYANLEVVVGDDHSTDDTWDVVRKLQSEFPDTIRAFRNENNLGVTANCNKTLQRCKGEYIALHAGDDVFLSGKVAAQVEVMESNPECVFCYHDTEEFDSKTGQTIRHWNSGDDGYSPVTGNTSEVARELVSTGSRFIAGQSIMVRQRAVPDEGYDVRLPVVSDWKFFVDICMLNDGSVRHLDETYTRRRRHGDNLSSGDENFIKDRWKALELFEQEYPELRDVVKQQRGYMYYRDGVQAILNDDPKQGRQSLVKGMTVSVYSWKWIGWWLYSWLIQIRDTL